jgi:DNA-binding transcriptional MerR regulator
MALTFESGRRLTVEGVSTYTIGQAAERSGFSSSALRYYEDIGLVVPASRTAAGYRLYDDAALARLAFIARAKHLGCSLEEITDLVSIWDGERCGPVQRRFHDLLTAKISAAQQQIDELTALVGQLHDAASHLEGPAVDGPCSPECACMTLDGRPPVARTAKRIPIYDSTAPIACTASSQEIPVRIEQLERMRRDLDGFERTEHGLLLHFSDRAGIEAEVRTFATDEKGCCAFWGFDTTTDDDRLTLRWDGPPEVAAFFDHLVEFFDGEQPLAAIEGLL